MRVPFAIVIAGLLIAAAIVFMFRWQIGAAPNASVYRLDRWTGRVQLCVIPPQAALTNPFDAFGRNGQPFCSPAI